MSRVAQATVQASLRDDEEWVEIERAILQALGPFPEAKSAVAQAIERVLQMEKSAPAEGTRGLNAALTGFDLERDGVLQRIKAPSLIITADRSALQSVEKVRKYQLAIPDSRLVVLQSDAYHVAVAKPEECLAHVLAFVREHA